MYRANIVIYGMSSGHIRMHKMCFAENCEVRNYIFRSRFDSIWSREGVPYDPYLVLYGPYIVYIHVQCNTTR